MNKTCQICDQGNLKAMVECIDVECEEHSGKIKSCLAKSDLCGSEQAANSDVIENKRAMTTFRKQAKATTESMNTRLA